MAKDSRFGRSAVAREGSHPADTILVLAAAGACRQDEELAAVAFFFLAAFALYKVAVDNPFVANCRRENRIGVLRATRERYAFCAERRCNCLMSAEREASEDQQTEDRELDQA